MLVTFLWSTSWVFIKIGLKEVPALSFAGLRYMLAFSTLLPFFIRKSNRQVIRNLSRRYWILLIFLGILLYATAQGAQYLGLDRLPVTAVSLLLNLTSPVVALLGIWLLRENPTGIQWFGIILNLAGIILYFGPIQVNGSQISGIIIVIIGMLANAIGSVISRNINRSRQVTPANVTTISMGIGAVIMLGAGVLTEGFPVLSLKMWGIVAWLSVVNTAFAFTLWNYTQQTLTAMESSVINSTMLIQIAVLGWIFLHEGLSGMEILGMVLAATGAVLVQIRKTSSTKKASETLDSLPTAGN